MTDSEVLLIEKVAEAIYRFAAHWFEERYDFDNEMTKVEWISKADDIIEMVDEIRRNPEGSFLDCVICGRKTYHSKQAESQEPARFCVLCGSLAKNSEYPSQS